MPMNHADAIAESGPRFEHWRGCAQKRCCRDAMIFLTGHDVVRIARALHVTPWTFTVAIDAPLDADDAFALDTSERRFRLALGRATLGDATHCAFLLDLPSGSSRCGLGALRPTACVAFPRAGGEQNCTCDWSGVPLEDVQSDAALARLDEDRARYAQIVASWNAFVVASSEAVEHRDFCRFVLHAYGEKRS